MLKKSTFLTTHKLTLISDEYIRIRECRYNETWSDLSGGFICIINHVQHSSFGMENELVL